jgi:UDP-N-acetylmuramyl pentapeptide phosphotransferase/UDP-N-acetylglucosamine-1-phosphate transferase
LIFQPSRVLILVFAIPHLALTAGGVASLAICLAIVYTKHLHGSHTLDRDAGVQKVHEEPTPRVGGVAILISAAVGATLTPPEVAALLWPMLFASLPAFLVGAIEDLFKRDSSLFIQSQFSHISRTHGNIVIPRYFRNRIR